MANKKRRRLGAGEKARQRALAAIAAGDAREAERWTRVADRLAHAAESAAQNADEERFSGFGSQEELDEVRGEVMRKMARFVEAEDSFARMAHAYELCWWEEGWNELRAEAGLAPLPLTPLPHPDLIAYAQANPPVDFLRSKLEAARARGDID